MNRKMKRTFLDIETKAEVLKKIKIGVEKDEILRKYEIGESSYYKFMRKETEIMNTLKKPENKHRRLFKKLKNEYLDDAVIKWYQQIRDRGDLVTGTMIREKAKIFNDKLNGPRNFKASSGWLTKFKKRFNIRLAETNGIGGNLYCLQQFSDSLKEKIISDKLSLENIYNADEAGIYWRTIVSDILKNIPNDSEIFPNYEDNDFITALLCTNASGNNRIPLLIIGKSNEEICLKNLIPDKEKNSYLKEIPSLGVIYANNDENLRMTQRIFKHWFEEIFIPRALNFQRYTGIDGKILLILDNAPCHSDIDELNSINENIEIINLPINLSALIQPIAQKPIEFVKKNYKKNLLTNFIISDQKNEDGYKYLKNFNYHNCFSLLNDAWNNLQCLTLQNVWSSFLGDINNLQVNKKLSNDDLEIDELIKIESSIDDDDDVKFSKEILNDLQRIFVGPNFKIELSEIIFRNWFENDSYDCGWDAMSDDDIVNFVQNLKKRDKNNDNLNDNDDNCNENNDNYNNNNNYDSDNDDNILVTDSENSTDLILPKQQELKITASEAYENLQIVKTWVRQKTSKLYINNFTVEQVENMISETLKKNQISVKEFYLPIKEEDLSD
ncbi:jerky protein homolog-like [Leptopilina boulardi]|uniref:jerky protein homolog-like n=1 Tax=Leptopilina boulardi TaxID=63433 RepID=UPI0021F65512|nr:jerky protein homolog-like [Leptopilina boulardi]